MVVLNISPTKHSLLNNNMKNLFTLIVLVTQLSWGQNIFNVNPESISVETAFTLSVDLNNNDDVSAFQFDISYNENAIELGTNHSLTDRANNSYLVTASNVANNTIRVIAYSTNNSVISSGSGDLINLNFSSKNLPGTYNLSISNIVISDASSQQLTADSTSGNVIITGPMYQLNTTSVDFDRVPIGNNPTRNITVSNDGNSTLTLNSYTLDSPFSISNSFPIDINPNSNTSLTLNIDSSTKQEVTKILRFDTNDTDGLRSTQSSSIHADIYAVNEIYVGSGEGEINTPISIPVTIPNMEPFSGFQLDITLPNNISYVEESVELSSRASDHLIAASVVGSNVLRIVSYSNTNSFFSGSSGEVFSFDLVPNVSSGTYSLNISNSIISNPTLGNIISDVYNGSITINSPTLSTNVQNIDYGRVPITEVQSTAITLQNSGSATLIIDELVIDNTIFSFPIEIPLSIEPNQSENTSLTFTPDILGIYDKDISIRHNGSSGQNVINVKADVFSPNYLRIVDQIVEKEQNATIALNLSNNDIVRAIQFDINLPTGFDLDLDNVISTALLEDFSVSSSALDTNNNYRFVIYSLSSASINQTDATILNLPVYVENSVAVGDYTFDISNVVLSNINNQNISSEALEVGTITVVEDATPPSVFCNDISISLVNNEVTIQASQIDNNSTDEFGIGSISIDINTFNCSNLGENSVVLTVTDVNGNSAQCTATVTVTDDTSPTITAPDAVSVSTNDGCTAIEVSLGSATTSDNCSVASTTNDAPTAFELGETTVTWTVTDGAGNTATTTQIVTVTDDTNPTITAPDAVSVSTNDGCTAIEVSLGSATTSDNCSVASTTNDAPTAFELGETTVTWTVTDGAGNTATTTQIVTVTDDTNPTITAPDAVSVSTNDGCTAIEVSLGSATTSDNCSVASTTNDAPTAFELGETTVTWTVTDGAGNTATTTQIVTVTDDTNPTITAPDAVSVSTNDGCTAIEVSLGSATTSDNCSVASTTNDAPTAFELGETTVTWTVTDGAGNTATTTQIVTVTDDTNPTITAPDAVSVSTNDGCTAIEVSLGSATTSDNCSVASTTNDAPTAFELGETTVTWTVTDGAGNTATTTQIVTVTDDTNPTINAPDAVSVSTNDGCTAIEVSLGSATTSDNCSVASTTNDAPTAFELGETTVTWTVTDGAGNTATTTQIVTVTDDTNPTITAPDAVSVSTNDGCTAIEVSLGSATTSDNCSVASTTNDAPTAFELGETTVTWTVTDGAGNTATTTQIVTVTDDTNPTALCNDITLTLEEGIAIISTEDINSGSFDQCGEISISISQTDFDESHIGDNVVILTVTDSSGNTDTCEATVTVEPGLSIEENILETINIYPNPTADVLYIKSNYSLDYDLFNIVGQKITSGSLLQGNNEINVKRLSDGVYFLNFFVENKTYSRKIVIKK